MSTEKGNALSALREVFCNYYAVCENVKELMYRRLKKVYGKFSNYCAQLPVLSFNGSRYDINLIKKVLAKRLNLHADSCSFTVKKNNSYMCISSESFRFLDIHQYLAPDCSYANFLNAFGVEEKKSYFPYEWFDSFS